MARTARHLLLTLFLACGVGEIGKAQSQSLLVNGSFEEGPSVGAWLGLTGGATSIKGWVVTGEGIDYVGGYWRSSNGNRSIDLDGSQRSTRTPPYAQGGIAQTFPTTPGESYSVTFDLAGNPAGPPTIKPLKVSAAGQEAEFTFDVTGKRGPAMGWVTKTWTFTAKETSTTLEFRSLTVSPATGAGAAIDNASVTLAGKSQAVQVTGNQNEGSPSTAPGAAAASNGKPSAGPANQRPSVVTAPPQANTVGPQGTATATPKGSAGCPPPPSAFGSKDKLLVGVEGKIYFLPTTTRKFPDFSTMTSEGSIYTAKWDVPVRAFTQGFPGVTDRFSWFAIDYVGKIYVSKAGSYGFRMASDDGSKLYIDDNVVIDLDGLHGWFAKAGKADLTVGEHDFHLSYMQGPPIQLGLQLWVTPPGEKEKIFNLQDFSKAVQDSRDQLSVTEDDKEIRVNVGAEVLFDTGKYVLKPVATAALEKLAVLLQSYPGLPIVIGGHTDNVGSDQSNEVLSVNRADAVRDWLVQQSTVPSACITTKGFGETMPVASNDTPEGRQKNRRVEIKLEKAKTP